MPWKGFHRVLMMTYFSLIFNIILTTYFLFYCSKKSNIRNVGNLQSFRSLIHLKFAESFGWSPRVSTCAHAPETVYSCEEAELSGAAPLTLVTSRLVSCASGVMKRVNSAGNSKTESLPLCADFTLLECLGHRVKTKVFYDVDPLTYHFYFSVVLSIFVLFLFLMVFFQWRKSIHLKVSWVIMPALIWMHFMSKVYMIDRWY